MSRRSARFVPAAIARVRGLKAVVSPPVTLGVRAMVLTPDREVLLVRHTYLPGWHLPGGAVDPGESARAAVRREVLEESGVALEGEARLFHLYWNRALAGRDHVALFVAEHGSRPDPAGFSSAEIAEAGFFPVRDLPPHTSGGTRRRLAEVLEGAAVSEEW